MSDYVHPDNAQQEKDDRQREIQLRQRYFTFGEIRVQIFLDDVHREVYLFDSAIPAGQVVRRTIVKIHAVETHLRRVYYVHVKLQSKRVIRFTESRLILTLNE